MNRVEDPRYDMIYLNPYDDVASGAEKEGADIKKEEPENKACNVKYYSLKEEEKEGRDCETSGKEVKNIEIDIELDDTVFKINNTITELTKKDGFYHCRYCDDFRDSDISQVWWHERMHTGGKHCCFICDKKFTHRRHLSRHMITHSGERPFQCTDCSKTFTRKEHMDRHRKLHLEGSRRPFQCTECNKTFTRKDHMYDHMKKHREKFEPIVKMDVDDCTIDINTSTSENDRAFSCQYCSYSSSHRSHLESHERTHTGVEDCVEKIYENLECNANKEGYDDKVHGEENYDNVGGEHRAAGIEQSEIDIGNFFAFDRKEDLVIHGKIDNDKKRHECPICNKRFTRKDRMKRHVIAHEKKLEKELAASIVKSENIKEERIEEVGKQCAEDEGIEVEEQCAEDERIEVEEYTKDVQVEIDTNKYVMIDGNASMNNEGFGEFRCRFCDNYSCTLKSDLVAHEKSHDKSREKTFQCEHCQLSFKRVHHLTRHIRVHTGERPFECSICTKAFARKDHLVKHLTVHTGAKPYECSFCHKAFARHYVLSRHEREKHHREESNNTR